MRRAPARRAVDAALSKGRCGRLRQRLSALSVRSASQIAHLSPKGGTSLERGSVRVGWPTSPPDAALGRTGVVHAMRERTPAGTPVRVPKRNPKGENAAHLKIDVCRLWVIDPARFAHRAHDPASVRLHRERAINRSDEDPHHVHREQVRGTQRSSPNRSSHVLQARQDASLRRQAVPEPQGARGSRPTTSTSRPARSTGSDRGRIRRRRPRFSTASKSLGD